MKSKNGINLFTDNLLNDVNNRISTLSLNHIFELFHVKNTLALELGSIPIIALLGSLMLGESPMMKDS